MLRALAGARIPLAVVNARMSERSFRAWRRFAPLARAVLGRVDLLLAQTPADAERLRALGAGRVVRLRQPEVRRAAAARRRRRRSRSCAHEIGGRPVLVAASTHPGEEAAVDRGARGSCAQAERATAHHPRAAASGARRGARGARSRAAGLSLGRRSQRRRDRRRHRHLSRRYDRRDGAVVSAGGHRLSRRLDGAAWRAESDRAGEARRADRCTARHVGNFRDVYAALAAARRGARSSDARIARRGGAAA